MNLNILIAVVLLPGIETHRHVKLGRRRHKICLRCPRPKERGIGRGQGNFNASLTIATIADGISLITCHHRGGMFLIRCCCDLEVSSEVDFMVKIGNLRTVLFSDLKAVGA